MVQTKRLQVTLGRLTIRSQDPRTLGETWLKNTCGTGTTSTGSWGWNTADVCSCSKCRRHLLHFRLSPSASAGISHSSRCSQALGTLAWPSHAVGPAPKEQQGGIAEISPFYLFRISFVCTCFLNEASYLKEVSLAQPPATALYCSLMPVTQPAA